MGVRPWYKRYGADFVHGSLGLNLEEKGAYSICLDLIYDRGSAIPDDERWLAGVCGCSIRKWRTVRASLIARDKLYEKGGFLSNGRADREIESLTGEHSKAVESGSTGGRKRAENAAKTSRKSTESRLSQGPIEAQNDAYTNNPNDLRQGTLNHRGREEARSQKPELEKEEDRFSSDALFGSTGAHLALVPTSPPKGRSTKVETTDFELWWKQYPRKVDKGAARKAYERVVKSGNVTPEQLSAGVLRYAAERQSEDPKFTKHPATWLNAEGWANETLPSVAAGQSFGSTPNLTRSRADSAIDGMMSYFNERSSHE